MKKNAFLNSLLVLLMVFQNSYLLADPLPSNPVDRIGSSTVTRDGNTMNVTTPDGRWWGDLNSFNIAQGYTLNSMGPSADAVMLYNVTGPSGSNISGLWNSNCNQFLINPNGILFSSTAQVNVGGLVASTLSISQDDFLSGKYYFENSKASPSYLINEGMIRASDGGNVALIAGAVRNSGTITTRLGSINLVSGDKVTLDLDSRGYLAAAVDDQVKEEVLDQNGEKMSDAVKNSGILSAEGGKVELKAEALEGIFDNLVNQEGTVRANSLVEHDGVVSLVSESDGIIQNSGTIDVSATETGASGGSIAMRGDKVGQFGILHADAVDGDGGNIDLIARTIVALSPFSLATANAGLNGDGGRIINYSPDTALFWEGARIEAKGGTLSGNGGFVEVSGKEHVEVYGLVDTSAPSGLTGNFLIDPYNVEIRSIGNDNNGSWGGGNPNIWTPSGTPSQIRNNNITSNLATSNVTITTTGAGLEDGDITVSGAINVDGGNGNTLTLQAHDDIIVNAAISDSAPGSVDVVGVTLIANSDASGGGSVDINANISTYGGTFASSGVNFDSTGATIDTSGGTANLNHTGTATLGAVNSGTLSVTAGGAITDSGALTVTGSTTLAAGAGNNITLDNANNFNSVGITSGNNVTLNDINAIALNASTVSGTLNVTSVGAITDNGILTVSGTTTLAAGAANNITLDNNNNFSSVGITSGNNVTLVDINAIGLDASSVSGTLNVTSSGAITDNAALTVAGATTLAAGAANNITLDNANDFSSVGITSGNNVTLNDTNAIALDASTISGALNVTTNGTITDNGALTVTGATTLAAGAGNDITLDNANNFNSVGITSGNNVTLNDTNALSLNASTVSGTLDVTTAGAITDNAAINVTGTATFAAGSGNNITLNNSNDFSTVGITTGNNVTLVDANAIDLAASTVSGTLNVTSNGVITDSGALTVTGATTLAAGAGNDITLNTAGNNFSSVGITTGNNVTLVDTNALALNASTISGNLNISTSGAITDNAAFSVSGTTTLAAGAANNITLDNNNNFSSVGITSGNNVTLVDINAIGLDASSVSGTLNVTSSGAITDNAALTVAGATTLAAGAANNITLDNANDFSSVGITSGNNVTLN
ncbi:MAG: filamentous hemagglutinin N-terminal domain-containing protein, partial [Candidatus Omnitrophica bacterium]|nr:filamentous hemagglutinin N-terminal domain-containing protein [Candidatus Omnitrophota bacterium]